MKWREPWAVSLKQQPPFNMLGREVIRAAFVWTGVFVVIGLVGNLGEALPTQLERAARLWFAPMFGVPLAAFIYITGWLSPRRIDSGPSGIVIVKGEQITLVPWQAIKSYGFARSQGHNVLQITDLSGDLHLLYLADTVHPKVVEREITKMIALHPNNSFKPTPLRGAA